MGFYITERMADIRVTLDGQPLFDVWATLSGGVLTAADVKTRPGGMGDEVSVPGGAASRDDCTVTIQFTDTVATQHKSIESRVSLGRVAVSANWLDANKVPIPGALLTRTGVLKSASEPNSDHNGTAVGMYTLVVSCDEKTA